MTSPAPEATGKIKGSHKLLAGIALTMGVVITLLLLFSHRGLYQIYRFRSERLKLEQENGRLEQENARLARTIDRLQHDPAMIQDLIRRELNFVKKNEIIFQLPLNGGTKTANPAVAPTVAPPASGPPKTEAKAGAGTKRFAWETLEGAPKKAGPGSGPR